MSLGHGALQHFNHIELSANLCEIAQGQTDVSPSRLCARDIPACRRMSPNDPAAPPAGT